VPIAKGRAGEDDSKNIFTQKTDHSNATQGRETITGEAHRRHRTDEVRGGAAEGGGEEYQLKKKKKKQGLDSAIARGRRSH